MSRDEATERQVQAARPDASTWLAANAGSGKTRVLTDRVARLLLDGVEPQNILCLTYTKAAASEMQNRLFRRLGEWAMLPDATLSDQLEKLGADAHLTADNMRRARTLFARAIETPGGLKIQTIHSFCAALLRRFPLEAGVSPQFTEMEDRAARILRDRIVEDFAAGPEAPLIDALAAYVTEHGFAAITDAILSRRDAFADPMEMAEILGVFGLPHGLGEATLLAATLPVADHALIARAVAAMSAGSATDQKNAAKLVGMNAADISCLEVLESVFLTGSGANEPFSAKLGTVPTKATQKANPGLAELLEPLMVRVEAARPQRIALANAQKSAAIHAFARAFLPEYERRKRLRGWLDFDDLIRKARQLLSDPAVAAWVLYRIDGGIDHILVDEAQDTSPEQWEVIERLAQEFTSGEGARPEVERTIFVVGDKKQSIYSFQGADPSAFDRMQAEFGKRLTEVGTHLENLTLEFSFRSSETILRLVDLVFDGHASAGFAADGRHRAFKSDMPGRVDLWPVVEPVADDDPGDWTNPLDRPSPVHHTVVLARRIADRIGQMIASETIPEMRDGQWVRRPVRAGDILILVQRRSELFAEIIRACKVADLPIAGADRLKVGAELAVKDLAALLKLLDTPEDSLSLASVLKSPLFGWSEQALFDLAARRDGPFLWQALRDRREEFPDTLAVLDDLRGQADFLRPYDLIERILIRHDGRRKLLARLGPEAEDGIDALLGQALSYERSNIPSLTGFLSWMETDELEIKRQLGQAGDMIRVMTVHGAKGLEAPVVILPDTGTRKPRAGGSVTVVDGVPLSRMPAKEAIEPIATAQAAERARDEEERLRLLYVALTRAETYLIVACAGKLGDAGDAWYQLVEAGMTRAGALPQAFPGGDGLMLCDDGWTALPAVPGVVPEVTDNILPEVFSHPAPLRQVKPEPLSPSDLGGAKALPGELGLEEDLALVRGSRVHLLLEHLGPLSPDVRRAAAASLLVGTAETDLEDALAEAEGVLSSPDLEHVFHGQALAEVPLTAEIAGRRIHGVIDRLIVTPDHVVAVDFKTNATVPETPEACPEGILRQMGAYAAALAQIYPDRRIETAILWTRRANLMRLPHDLVTDALGRTPHLDDVPRAT